jgi:hypothetical protein
MGETCSTHGELRSVYKFVGKPRRRGEDNIKIDLK